MKPISISPKVRVWLGAFNSHVTETVSFIKYIEKEGHTTNVFNPLDKITTEKSGVARPMLQRTFTYLRDFQDYKFMVLGHAHEVENYLQKMAITLQDEFAQIFKGDLLEGGKVIEEGENYSIDLSDLFRVRVALDAPTKDGRIYPNGTDAYTVTVDIAILCAILLSDRAERALNLALKNITNYGRQTNIQTDTFVVFDPSNFSVPSVRDLYFNLLAFPSEVRADCFTPNNAPAGAKLCVHMKELNDGDSEG